MRKVALVCVYALMLWGCDMRCHTQHTVVEYHPAYTTMEESCFGAGEEEFCVSYPVSHSASCNVWVTCDLRCKTLDKGKLEAHTPHDALVTGPVVDSRCTLDGRVK